MLKNGLIKILLTIAIVGLSNASSASISARDLLNNCKNAIEILSKNSDYSASAVQGGVCMGFVAGLIDAYVDMSILASSPPHNIEDIKNKSFFCLEKAVSNEQIARMFVKYIEANPEEMNKDASIALLKMLIIKYPCT